MMPNLICGFINKIQKKSCANRSWMEAERFTPICKLLPDLEVSRRADLVVVREYVANMFILILAVRSFFEKAWNTDEGVQES